MAHRTRVKICGITRLQDANLAQKMGADALGFVFVPASKRYVTPEAAAAIVRHLSPFVTPVGLFLDADQDSVSEALDRMPSLVPQFHGRESADECEQYNRPYLKALGVGQAGEIPSRQALAAYESAMGFLFDSHEPGELGGTGQAFDWHRLHADMDRPLILAGGLHADNVAQAITQVRPWAVDVSSGVEQSRGIKDAGAMQAFMTAVSSADAHLAAEDSAA